MSEINWKSFNEGARAMFDHFHMRAANNWHANPAQDALRAKDNELCLEWIEDALNDVSPEHLATWHEVTKLIKFKDELKIEIANLRKIVDADLYIGRLVRSKLAGLQAISHELTEVPIAFCTISLDEVNEIDNPTKGEIK